MSLAYLFLVSFLATSSSNYPLNPDPFQNSLMALLPSYCVFCLNLFWWPQPPSFCQWTQYLYCHVSPFSAAQTPVTAFRISPLGCLTDASDSTYPNWTLSSQTSSLTAFPISGNGSTLHPVNQARNLWLILNSFQFPHCLNPVHHQVLLILCPISVPFKLTLL